MGYDWDRRPSLYPPPALPPRSREEALEVLRRTYQDLQAVMEDALEIGREWVSIPPNRRPRWEDFCPTSALAGDLELFGAGEVRVDPICHPNLSMWKVRVVGPVGAVRQVAATYREAPTMRGHFAEGCEYFQPSVKLEVGSHQFSAVVTRYWWGKVQDPWSPDYGDEAVCREIEEVILD